jgi:hypothetical protein
MQSLGKIQLFLYGKLEELSHFFLKIAHGFQNPE